MSKHIQAMLIGLPAGLTVGLICMANPLAPLIAGLSTFAIMMIVYRVNE